MGPELLARVRWNNVGVVALAAALLTLVVAWPALSPPPPSLPEDEPRRSAPVATPEPAPGAPAVAVHTEPSSPRVRSRRPRATRRAVRKRAARRHRPRPATPVQAPRAPAPVPAGPAYAPPPPAPEFAFER
jgi:hypothetical protein